MYPPAIEYNWFYLCLFFKSHEWLFLTYSVDAVLDAVVSTGYCDGQHTGNAFKKMTRYVKVVN